MLSRKDFEKIQKKTGFNLDLLEKTYHLTRTLYELHHNNLLQELNNPDFVQKGDAGTLLAKRSYQRFLFSEQ